MNYATLADTKEVLDLTDNTANDTLLEVLLGWATTHIDNYKGRWYEPRVETRLYDVPNVASSSFGRFADPHLLPAGRAASPLRLDADLLEVIELLNGDGEEITEYLTEPANQWPKTRIRLTGAQWQADADGNYRQVISLTGVFGCHDAYTLKAWKNSGYTVLNNPLSSGATSISVSALTGFQVGQLLRLEDEYVLITALVTTPANPPTPASYSLTVRRAENGTTAAAHAAATPIEIWQVQGNVNQACIRLVKWRYSQKDVDNFDRTYSGETGIISIPTAIPVDVLALLGAPKATI